jgi:predicted ATPase
MNTVSAVTITGFWDTDCTVSLPLNPDVNFLIGANGTGKSTTVNLIAAALNADFSTLDRLSFEQIRLELRQVKGNTKPVIEIDKLPGTDTPYSSIRYRIRDKTTDKAKEYTLEDFEEQLAFRDYPPARLRRRVRQGGIGTSIQEHLRLLVDVTWLSIHRVNPMRPSREERSHESTVDKRLGDLSTDFVAYFLSLARQAEAETAQFQKNMFLSLVRGPKQERQFVKSSEDSDTDEERRVLLDVFEKFGLQRAEREVEEHFNVLKQARERMRHRQSLDLRQLAAVVGNYRIHTIAQEWNELVKRQAQIYELRDLFLTTVNPMLRRKRLLINERDQIVAQLDGGRHLSLTQLSSGEKQLVIILGECLLQQKKPAIFIADEPELSLHVTWQAQLVDAIRDLNPMAQVIFATHSPDIVGRHRDKVFDMENVVP